MGKQENYPIPSEVLADEIRGQGIDDKLRRYDSAKQNALAVASYILDHEPTLHKYHKALSECGSWLVFRDYYEIQQHRLIKANLCKKHHLCNLCALRRTALQAKAFEPKLAQVLSENPSLVPLLITLTVVNGEDLQERFNHIDNARKSMIKRRNNALAGRRTDTVLKYIQGGAGSYEIKRGKNSGLYHPHIHMIALIDKDDFEFTDITDDHGKPASVPLQFKRMLLDEWKKQTGDSKIIDVRKIDAKNGEDVFGAICESFKYALKFDDGPNPSEQNIADRVHAAKVLSGRRLQFSFGNLHGVKINENLLDEFDSSLEAQKYIDRVYSYLEGAGYSLQEVTDFGDLKQIRKEDAEDYQNRKRKGHTQDIVSKKSGINPVEVDIWLDNKKAQPDYDKKNVSFLEEQAEISMNSLLRQEQWQRWKMKSDAPLPPDDPGTPF